MICAQSTLYCVGLYSEGLFRRPAYERILHDYKKMRTKHVILTVSFPPKTRKNHTARGIATFWCEEDLAGRDLWLREEHFCLACAKERSG